jgi:hypothetical protein
VGVQGEGERSKTVEDFEMERGGGKRRLIWERDGVGDAGG